ncbi:MAG: hypothetical protein V4459_08840 [Pseudomonadota bacterium]
MGSVKTVFGLVGVLIPIAYCAGLAYYFFGVSGNSLQGATAIGLGPTILGLAAIGLLFCVPLLIKLVRLGSPTPARGKPARGSEDADEPFDADAALARYMARKAAEGGSSPTGSAEPPRPQGFGRRAY